jgi:hypothetical protein
MLVDWLMLVSITKKKLSLTAKPASSFKKPKPLLMPLCSMLSIMLIKSLISKISNNNNSQHLKYDRSNFVVIK